MEFLQINFDFLSLKNLLGLRREMFYLFMFKSFSFYFLRFLLAYRFCNSNMISFLSLFNFVWRVSMNFKITNFQIFISPILLILFFNDELNIQYALMILNDVLKTIHFTYFQFFEFKFIKNVCFVFYWKTIQATGFPF